MVEIGARNISRCTPSKRYQNYYNRINKLYFYGSLPPAKVLVAPLLNITRLSQKKVKEKDENKDWEDAGEYAIVGWDDQNELCIILDKGTSVFHPLITKQSVIHESIHVFIGFEHGHGKKFKQEIRRVAALGAFDTLI